MRMMLSDLLAWSHENFSSASMLRKLSTMATTLKSYRSANFVFACRTSTMTGSAAMDFLLIVFIEFYEFFWAGHDRQSITKVRYRSIQSLSRIRVINMFEIPSHNVVDVMNGSNRDVNGIRCRFCWDQARLNQLQSKLSNLMFHFQAGNADEQRESLFGHFRLTKLCFLHNLLRCIKIES